MAQQNYVIAVSERKDGKVGLVHYKPYAKETTIAETLLRVSQWLVDRNIDVAAIHIAVPDAKDADPIGYAGKSVEEIALIEQVLAVI